MLTILSGLALQSPTFLSPRLLSTFFCPLHRYHCDRPGNPKWSWHARWSLMSEGLACLSVTAPHLGTPAAPLSKFTLRLRLRCSLTFSERVGPFGACLGTCSLLCLKRAPPPARGGALLLICHHQHTSLPRGFPALLRSVLLCALRVPPTAVASSGQGPCLAFLAPSLGQASAQSRY